MTLLRGARACLALLAAAALLALAAPAQAQTEVWTATLTPGDLGFSILGCSNGVDAARCSSTSVLSEDSFNYDSTDYTITKLFVRSGGDFEFEVDADITTATAALTLVVGSTSLVLADADTITTRERIWVSSGVSLTAGTDIVVKLIAPDTTPPEVESVTVPISGSEVELVFDEDLDEPAGDNLLASVFSLTVAGQAVTIPDYAIREAVLILTVQTGTIKQGQTVVVSYTDPTAADDTVALQDIAGNDVASFTTGQSGVPAVTNNSTVADTTTPVSGVLVSNIGQTQNIVVSLAFADYAHSFTTGANDDGYTLTSIELSLDSLSSTNTPTVKLFRGSANGTEVSTFTGPAMLAASGSANYTFTPSSTVDLLTSTTYWVVVEGDTHWSTTNSTREDATSAMGWSIADSLESRSASSTGGFTASAGKILQIRVNGTTIPNTPPTAANNTVTAGVGAAYTFEADHFGFADADTGDTLASVKIVTLPAAGTLALDGTPMLANAVVTKAQIDGGMLTFTPVAGASGIGYASFTFKVNDGTDDSADAYTMTIDVAELPAITIAADRPTATGKLDWIHYTLSRDGDTAAELAVTVILAGHADNDWGLDTAKTSQDVTFAAGSAMAEQSIRLTGEGPGQIGFSLSATTSGALTARLGATTGYDTSDTDEVAVVVTSGPAWVIKVAEDAYSFDEDGGAQDIEVVATAASAAMPAPSLDRLNSTVLYFSYITHAGTATADVDYASFSRTGRFPPSTCSADAGNVQVCRFNVTFTPVGDAVVEPDETLEFQIAGGLGAPPAIQFQGPGPDRTVSSSANYPITIVNDDEFGVTGVDVTSTPQQAVDTYGAWEHIEISVSFNRPVTVTGAPTFTFDLGGTTTAAAYQGGSGTGTLVFSYQVLPGDSDSDGIAWAATALAGGAIVETGGTDVPTTTAFDQLALPDHKVDGTQTASGTATVSTVAVTSVPLLMASGSTSADTYGVDETIKFTVTFSAAVTVTGDPQFGFSMSSTPDRLAAYASGSGTTALVFRYRVKAADEDTDGIWVGNQSRTLKLDSDDRILTMSNSLPASLTHSEQGTKGSHKVDGSRNAGTACAAPDFGTRRNIWTSTVDVEAVSSSGFLLGYGFNPGTGAGTLTDNTFSVGANDYTVDGIIVIAPPSSNAGDPAFSLTEDLTSAEVAALKLHVCDTSYDFADATHTVRIHSYRWEADLDWSGETSRTVYLSLPANNAPTAADNTVTTGVGAAYTFEADDFGFADTDAIDALASVKIVTLPAAGALALDGTAVSLNQIVAKADIDDNKLIFTPVADASGTGYASFTFKVNDGTDDSASAYTMTIDVVVLPAITIAADRATATGKLDWVHYTLNREGDTAAELTVTVTFAGPADNDWSLDPTGSAKREVTFAADSATAEQSIRVIGSGLGHIGFSESAAMGGTLTARLGAKTGYDTSDTDEVEVVVTSGPAWVIKLAEDHYRFDEDGGDQDIELMATAASADMPAPSLNPTNNRSVLSLSLVTTGGTAEGAEAGNPGDYLSFSVNPYFTSSTCSADPDADNVLVCRSNVTFTPIDDAEAEPDETLELALARGLGAPPSIHLQGPGPDRTVSLSAKTYTVTIVDDEFGVTGVTVTSTPRLAMDTYGAREHIELSVSFNKPVTVTGEPTFTFDLGGTTTTAAYQGGSGTGTLVFSHQVMPDDADTNGIAWAANALTLAGGTIVETGGTAAPTLTVAVQSALSDHKVNGALTAPPAITIAAGRPTATGKLDWIHYTLSREGDTAAELTVTVTFAGPADNDWSLSATKNSREVTFAADSAMAEQSIRLTGHGFGQIGFSLSATTSGALTARLGATTGYDTSDTDEVEVVVTSGPAWVIKLAEDHYRFDEDGGDQDIELVATATSADMPAPSLDPSDNSVLYLSIITQQGTAEAHAEDNPGDFLAFSATPYFTSSTCSADPNAGNVQVCRSNVTFTPVDDGEEEPDETLKLALAAGLGAPPLIHFQGPGPDRTVSGLAKTYTVTIVDDDFRVMGAATISGAPQVGQTLTAVTTGIRDPDGLTTANYMYQWIRVDGGTEADISGANSSTYTLLAAALGKTIKVRVTFTDDASNAETRTSVATATVIAAPPATCGVPDFGSRRNIWTGALTVEAYHVSGSLVAHGFDSIASVGALAPTRFHTGLNGYTVDGVGVPAVGTMDGDLQFGLTRDLTAAEVAALRLHVCDTTYDFSAANPVASDSTYTWADDLDWSGETTLTLYLSLPANNPATGTPTITGTATVGQELTADASPIMDIDGLTGVDFTYQWIRVDADGTSNEEDISGEIAATYTLSDDDVGKKVKVKVSFTDELSGEEERTSAAFPSSVTVAGVTDVDEPPDAPATPAVTAVSGSTTSLTVSWAAPANAGRPDIDNYDVQYRAGTSGTWTRGPQNVTTTTTTVTGLVANTLYQARVRATNAEGNSGWSSPPGAGRTNALGVSQTRALVSNTGQLNSGHRVVGADEYAQPFDTGNNSDGYSLTGIVLDLQAAPTGSGTLTITVRADSSGSPVRAALYTLANPALAAGLNEFLAPENAELHANTTYWVVATYSADTGGPAWYRTVRTYGLDAGAAAGWAIDAPYKIDGRVAQDGWVVHSLPRTLQIAVKGTVIGGANTAPTAADNTVATTVDTPYTFTADDFGFTDTDFANMLASVRIVTVPAAGTLALDGTAVLADAVVTKAQIDGDMLTFTPVAGASGAPYTTFTFKVNDGTDDSANAYTMTIDVTAVAAEPPSAPATPIVSAVSGSSTSLSVSWAAPANAGKPPIDSYDVQYRVGNSGDWSDGPEDVMGTTATVTGLAADTDYEVRVRATNAEGNSGWSDPPGSGRTNATITPNANAPSAPRFLKAFTSDRHVMLSWFAPARDGGSSISKYEYRHASGTSVPDDTPWSSGTSNRLQAGFGSLRNGQLYTFQVRAVGAEEGPAASVTATPSAKPVRRLPGAVSGLAATAEAYADDHRRRQYGRVSLSWNPPAGDDNSVLERFEYRYAESGSALPARWLHGPSDRLSETVKRLKLETVYVFEVRAVNLEGPGPAVRTTIRTPASAVGAGLISLYATQSTAIEGGALTFEVRRAAHKDLGPDEAYVLVGVTDSAFPDIPALGGPVGGTGAGGHVVQFQPGATSATDTITVEFDGARPASRSLTITLESVQSPYYYGTPETLVIQVTDRDAGLRVRDARVREGPGAILEFSVTLDRRRDREVAVNYATSDGTATQGDDYTRTAGTLVFSAGERSKTVSVPVIDDAHNEDSETLTLTLSNARGAAIDDATAVGTIVNSDPLPDAWLSRFGRAASDHVVQSIGRRLEGGESESHLTVMGWRMDTLLESSHSERDAREPRADAPGRQPDGSVRAPDGRIGPPGAMMAGATRGVGAMPGPGAARSPFDGAMTRGFPPMQGGTLQSPARAVGGLPGNPGGNPASAAAMGARDNRWLDLMGRLFMRLGPNAGEALAMPGLRDMVMGSSFYYGNSPDAGPRRGMNRMTAWGESASTRFSGAEGKLSLDGEVNTAIVGADGEWGRWLAGLALSYSEGEGGYRQALAKGGAVSSTLTGVNPYARYRVDERTSFWGTLGYGSGRLTLTPDGAESSLETDMTNAMAAFGGRGVLSMRAGETGQFELALRSDAMLTDTASTAVTGLAAGEGATSRIRLILEGSGALPAFGGVLAPKVEAGLRYDGGDAETGAGLEVGGGLAYDMARLTVQADGRVLLTHRDRDYEEWGYSLSFVYQPGEDGRGLRYQAGSQWGATQSGVQSLWSLQNAAGLANGARTPNGQGYTAELGYGFGVRRLWYPYVATESAGASSQALRFGLNLNAGSDLEAGLEIGRRAHMSGQMENDIRLRLRARW